MGIFSFGKKKPSNKINWEMLEDENTLNEIIELSKEKPVMILKHSTRCSISSMALSRLENNWDLPEEKITPYYLDLIQFRNVSNAIATKFRVMHQSPQILVIKNGECVLDASHNSIDVEILREVL